MHDLGRFIRAQLDKTGTKPAELAKAAGLQRQTVHNLLNDPRPFMEQTPQRKTLEALAKGLGVPVTDVLVAAARAIGVPSKDLPPAYDLGALSDAALVRELATRLDYLRKGSDGNVSTAPITRAGESPATEGDDATQDDFDMAAYNTGRESQGRRLRRLQDEAAEASQDGA